MVREAPPESFWLIVIAGNNEERLCDLRQDDTCHVVFSRAAFVHDIAAEEHDIWPGTEVVQMTDGGQEHRI